MIRRLRCACLVLLLTSIASSASAQSWEMSGFAGYTPNAELERHADEIDGLHIRGGFTFGIQAARFFTPRLAVELVFTEQASALEADTRDGPAEFYGITIGQVHANVVYQFGAADSRFKPFVFGGAGGTFFSATDLESTAKASFGFGGGVKYFPWESIGLRGQMLYRPTFLNDDPDSDFCAPFGFCQGWLNPIEFTAGVVIRF